MTVDRASDGAGGVISTVAPDSLAERLGLEPGDQVLSINGHRLRDVIDVRFYASEPLVRMRVRSSGAERLLEAERRYDEPLGITFVDPIFNRIRRCNNSCEFCFVAQMPQGLRPSLYLKDDDYRLSFLHGSYVTMTNLTEVDWERIEEQHLSPLYVSVHATETDLRRRFLGSPDAPDVMEQLGRLAAMDIVTHTQIVVRPGVNDGSHLDRSIEDLVALYPAVRSVSVVPVGLTKHHRFDCRLLTDSEMRAVWKQINTWQSRLRDRLGVGFVYLSDEWYLRLNETVPDAGHYDGLDLTENGVGLVRRFLDSRAKRVISSVTDLGSATLVTGTLFAPVLRDVVSGTEAEVVSVVNRFFGDSVTVAGLLTGQDVMAALQDRDLGEVVFLPPAMFGGPEGQSVDEMWPTDLQETLGRRVISADM